MNTKIFHLPPEISLALDTLNKKGFKAYIVGGAVRDFVMGNPISDFDITTDATPDEIHSVFEKCIDTGLSHGTVTVVINHIHMEITTFRQDGKYTDHRRPDDVSFSKKLEDDLSRRDFTINALAYNPETGITDIFGGMDDIENKLIRCVGDAEKRFEEDALRMLRLIRFSSKLGFDAEEKTLLALIKKEDLIKYVSKERIREEIIKTFLSDCPQSIFQFKKSRILDYIFENDFFKCIDEKIIANMKSIPKIPTVRLAYLLYEVYSGSYEYIKDFLIRLKFSNKEKKDILNISACVKEYLLSPDRFIDKYTLKFAMKNFSKEAVIASFHILSLYTDISFLEALFEDVQRNKEPYLIKDLKIDGKNLLDMGFRGETTGKCLEHLLSKVIKDPLVNTKEHLIKEAEKYYAKEILRKN